MTGSAAAAKVIGDADAAGQPKFARDRFFDPWRAPRSEEAKALVADVIHQVESYERHRRPRQRRRKQQDQAVFEETVAAIVCDLVHGYLSGHETGIAITRSNRQLGKKSRYMSRIFGKKLPEILDHLSSREMAFVEQDLGYRNPFVRNQRTLIRPGRQDQVPTSKGVFSAGARPNAVRCSSTDRSFLRVGDRQLQFRESQIMVEVLLRLQDEEIIAFPVHDAVITPASDEEITRRVMSDVFLDQVGVEAIIKKHPPDHL